MNKTTCKKHEDLVKNVEFCPKYKTLKRSLLGNILFEVEKFLLIFENNRSCKKHVSNWKFDKFILKNQ